MTSKKTLGQFFTANSDYILNGMRIPDGVDIIEPFAGSLDLVKWCGRQSGVEKYDIDPKHTSIEKRDTLANPPDYNGKWVVTNPPYLARNKSLDKSLFDKYEANDLYKCFLYSIGDCDGGIIIIPAGFFMSPRDIDIKCRNYFMERFIIKRVNYFEERVFEDTSTTVVSILFDRCDEKSDIQSVEWNIFPSKQTKTFEMKKEFGWIIGGEIYNMNKNNTVKLRRFVSGMKMKDDEYISGLTLHALDSGNQKGRIKLVYETGKVYEGKPTSRSFATLCLNIKLTEVEQRFVADEFTRFIEEKRDEFYSMFLPMYRESKEYSRKRIPFELAYDIISHIISMLRSL